MTDIDQRYRSFGAFLKETFGEKVYKVSIHAGFTCPNRDGTLGTGGCIYCNNQGFSPNTRHARMSVREQVDTGIGYIRKRYKAEKYIAYFQAYTNTYGPYDQLKSAYDEALSHPRVVGLSVGTRPDCLEDDVLELLAGYARDGCHVWIELGLQSMHDQTLKRIKRHHTVTDFANTVRRIKQFPDLHICAHVILGLPGENREMMLQSATFLSDLGVHGIKVHLLHVLRDTPLEEQFRQGTVRIFNRTEYVTLVCDYLELLDPDMVIQRLTADGPSHLLLAPRWAMEKKKTVDMIEKELRRRNTRQGALR